MALERSEGRSDSDGCVHSNRSARGTGAGVHSRMSRTKARSCRTRRQEVNAAPQEEPLQEKQKAPGNFPSPSSVAQSECRLKGNSILCTKVIALVSYGIGIILR